MFGFRGCTLFGGRGAVPQPVVKVCELVPEIGCSVAKISRLLFGVDDGVSSPSGFGLGPACASPGFGA
jgi:hypothetical protein